MLLRTAVTDFPEKAQLAWILEELDADFRGPSYPSRRQSSIGKEPWTRLGWGDAVAIYANESSNDLKTGGEQRNEPPRVFNMRR